MKYFKWQMFVVLALMAGGIQAQSKKELRSTISTMENQVRIAKEQNRMLKECNLNLERLVDSLVVSNNTLAIWSNRMKKECFAKAASFDQAIEELISMYGEDYYLVEQLKQKPEDEEVDTYVFVEEQPTFPGGEEALYEYLGNEIIYPEAAREANIEGKVYIRFVIEKDGSVTNVRVMRDIGGGCGEEAKRVVKQMPKWKPGTQRGKTVRSEFTIPVNFTLG